MELKNYPDRKCCYGYMTLCSECAKSAPHWVEVAKPIEQVLPADRCEMCKRKGTVSV